MCNGSSARTSLGGAVVVVHPTSNWFRSCLLQFHNAEDTSPTNLSYTLDGARGSETCEVRIHTLGDLTTGTLSAGEILHSLTLEMDSSGALQLDRRLDLGVGGDGIVGRTVSVAKGGVVLGEGIIGWN